MLQFFFNSFNIGLYKKTVFRLNIGPREVFKIENPNFHFHAFSGWCTSRGLISNLKAVF